ncbi:MAG: type II toxin-antitoxin system HicB family antitoxin [Defluviitaleaceae bacterium]|nr:type II toxin-antitoxin system HicB family antitoxin [Defluviitaleaceae bacterium]
MKLAYPVCFYKEETGYSAIIPDLGCATHGENLPHATEMAIDAASGWILTAIEDGEDIPMPSDISNVKLEYENGFINVVLLDIGEYALKYGDKSAKKNVTIPA